MSPVVELQWYEIQMGAYVGIARHIRSFKLSQTNKVQNKDFGWHTDIEGACAEVATAKYLNIYWDGSVDTFKLPDVGNFQVKHTQHPGGSLIFRKELDPSYFYILVTGSRPLYTLRGFMLGEKCMKDEYLSNPNNTKNGEAFFFPQNKLWDIGYLKSKIQGGLNK